MQHMNCSCETYLSGGSAFAPPNRRQFLKLGALGGAAALLGPVLPRFAFAAGSADALLLNCIDYRLTDKVTAYMAGRGLAENYDQFILAGAALGAVTREYPDWGKSFRDHLALAIKLHGIHRVVVIDHRDCGAYKLILGKDLAGDPAEETKIHGQILARLKRQILTHHPALAVETGIMALDGSVQMLS